MMCVQFFGNYEQDIKHAKETLVSSHEAKLNKRLPPMKRVLLPDVLQAYVSRHIGFTSTRQTFRPTIEPLHPVRIYTVHDNIDITEQNSALYSIVNNSITYNILLKPTGHQGYVQLQLLHDSPIPKKITKGNNVDRSSIEEDGDELYSGIDSIYGAKAKSVRSDYSVASEKSRRDILKESKFHITLSLPNLYEEGLAVYEDHRDLLRSNRNIRNDVDYDNSYSLAEQRHPNKSVQSKGGYSNQAKETPLTKKQGLVNQEHTSSNSSGYRTDNYATGSDSSSRFSQSYNSDKLDESWISNAKLPNRCFKRVTYTADGKIYDPKEEEMYLLNSKQRRIKEALKRHNYDVIYISSTEFMKHFIKMFKQKLGDSLTFDEDSLEDMRREGCVLYCDKIMVSDAFKHSRVEQYEIIPAIWLEWPICAQEWLDRPRNHWPTSNDVDKVKSLGSYVVPEGFIPKHGNSNLIEDLEWQLTFPTAERYLETCMTQAQAKIYLIALMLHKTFMRPIFDTMFSLTTAHIKHRLFWMIEEDGRSSKWPDNGMGACLLKLLNSLYYSISQNEPILKDYFIKDRNLFQRIPCEHLLHTQKQLKRIIENPVIYIFHAMENIRYNDNFFPRLNFEMLLKILTENTLTLINPMLVQTIPDPTTRPRGQQSGQDNKYDRTAFWDMIKTKSTKQSVQLVTNKTLINPRKATDSIIEISTRCVPLDGLRLAILLSFFIEHFIQIGERCIQYQADQQKAVYLDHADRLSILLFEHPCYRNDARAFRDRIKVLRKKTMVPNTRNDRSNTSTRKPETAIYVASLNDRFTDESAKKDDSLPETNKRPDPDVHRVEIMTKAIIHDRHYEKMKELDVKVVNNKKTLLVQDLEDRSSTIENGASESNSDVDKKQLVVSFRDLSEPATPNFTYI
ncbi:hypothetical protein WN48_01001 [Eufriesea mexicana]|nr:hypothetical protein WN48_01001 [Eufriesea mexicana]